MKSHRLLAHEALLRRLHLKFRHNEKLQVEYLKQRAGFYGEKALDYKLSLFPHREFLHYPDLRLHNFSNYFQIDSIILTPKAIFILEAKHLRGIVEYHGSRKQFIHITDEQTTSYKDPILQAETQKKHLLYWLQQHQIQIPVETLVVSTNDSTIIRNLDNDDLFNHRFVTLENLLFKIEEIYQSYTENIMDIKDMHMLYKIMLQKDEPAKTNLLQRYKINRDHLIYGVFCDSCQNGHYTKTRYNWECSNCKKTSKYCHEQVILDYFLLHDNQISNAQTRDLLKINSRNTAYRLLDKMELKKVGERKGRKYQAPHLSQFPQDAEPQFVQQSILEQY